MGFPERDTRIIKTKEDFLNAEERIRSFIRSKGLDAKVHVSVRFYRLTPCGPLFIFGDHFMLAGFYDHRWTSDSAPLIRLESSGTPEWEYFSTLFECTWGLRQPEGSDEPIGTEKEPDWLGVE